MFQIRVNDYFHLILSDRPKIRKSSGMKKDLYHSRLIKVWNESDCPGCGKKDSMVFKEALNTSPYDHQYNN